uniref:Uncharacterized protein n=1 Tax=Siphoviridae sp. ctLkp13 TaxID=2826252 RepID=A0A8S5LSV0_9CAUD|nr:MAG TPA: hypothetical protein [Siphoviridae sp. ctLkp13]
MPIMVAVILFFSISLPIIPVLYDITLLIAK